MSNANITTNGIKLSRTILRTIQRHIQKWIDRETSLLFLPKNAEYSVHLEQEAPARTNCRVTIQIGSRSWSGLAYGHSAQDALLNTLSHLVPTPAAAA